MSYGGAGLGSALANDPYSHQSQIQAGVSDVSKRVESESAFKIIKDVKVGLKDADPNARVQELKKLRDISDPEVNRIIIDCLSDPDLRVKIKAVDLLGARQANDGVPPMSQLLFLRSTEPLLKLHAAAALGRIGDSRGALPVMEYLEEETDAGDDDRARGTAVFALGEIGSDKSTELLSTVVAKDKSDMVRRLAQEAIEKIDGELPSQHSTQLAAEKTKLVQPTDEKLAKLREFDAKMQEMER
ncbi:MAG TPA: HEAT repeat domain-containing protein [Candidatus Binataceae bacterium]|jgi:HEAT repeat protein|nr:HEAT repeat domain-containing protein [Candidatus Binataceae bacterium]